MSEKRDRRGRKKFSGVMIPCWLKIKNLELPIDLPKEQMKSCIRLKKIQYKHLKEAVTDIERLIKLIQECEFELVYFPESLKETDEDE